MKANKQFWNNVYESGDYLKKWDYSKASPELVALLASPIFTPNSTVVDLGCGTGEDAIFMALQGHQVSAIDISQKALDLAKEKAKKAGIKINLQQADFLNLPLDDASVDFINDRGSLHLLDEADWPELAKEIQRVLKPGGMLFMRGASPTNPHKGYTVVTQQLIEHYFDETLFSHGPILPITLISDQGSLEASLVLIRKHNV